MSCVFDISFHVQHGHIVLKYVLAHVHVATMSPQAVTCGCRSRKLSTRDSN